MSDEYHWQQLGTVVNNVLMQARTQAIRNGSVSKVSSLGFLAEPETAPKVKPKQLELPFGIGAGSSPANFGKPQAPRGIRLV